MKYFKINYSALFKKLFIHYFIIYYFNKLDIELFDWNKKLKNELITIKNVGQTEIYMR